MTERLNMPVISDAARRELDKYPNSLKSFNGQPSKQPTIIITCQECNKPYDKVKAEDFLSDFPELNDTSYENTCLTCIKEDIDQMKERCINPLKNAKHELEELALAYQNAHNHYNSLSKEYKSYDYQSSRIKHHLAKPVIAPKTAKKASKNKASKTPQSVAMKILASLTQEQRDAILKNM